MGQRPVSLDRPTIDDERLGHMRVTTKPSKQRQSFPIQTKDNRNGKRNSRMGGRYMDARYRSTKAKYWRIDDADVVTVGSWRVKELWEIQRHR